MTFANLPANVITIFSGALLVVQTGTLGGADLTGVVGPIERLTLVGALLVAVRVLWGSNTRKDEQIIQMAQKLTETMVSVMDAVRELRKATEESGAAMDNLSENVALLSAGMPPKE
jgi:hypothetical protein